MIAIIEFPEAFVLARQLNDTIVTKKIARVTAGQTPHKFAWFNGDPQKYHGMLAGKSIDNAAGYGGMVEIQADSMALLFGDGVNLRFHGQNEPPPQKHQLLVEFEDGSAVSATVQMYGGLWCFGNGNFDNVYYKTAKEKPSLLLGEFDEFYFDRMISSPNVHKLSAKALLATEQRIPGLGNGVLQDILWDAKIHPKRKVNTLAEADKNRIFHSIKTILSSMATLGGRNTEKDLFGNNGGYQTVMSKNNAGLPCPACGDLIKKESYLGGSIYFCPGCQNI